MQNIKTSLIAFTLQELESSLNTHHALSLSLSHIHHILSVLVYLSH